MHHDIPLISTADIAVWMVEKGAGISGTCLFGVREDEEARVGAE